MCSIMQATKDILMRHEGFPRFHAEKKKNWKKKSFDTLMSECKKITPHFSDYQSLISAGILVIVA